MESSPSSLACPDVPQQNSVPVGQDAFQGQSSGGEAGMPGPPLGAGVSAVQGILHERVEHSFCYSSTGPRCQITSNLPNADMETRTNHEPHSMCSPVITGCSQSSLSKNCSQGSCSSKGESDFPSSTSAGGMDRKTETALGPEVPTAQRYTIQAKLDSSSSDSRTTVTNALQQPSSKTNAEIACLPGCSLLGPNFSSDDHTRGRHVTFGHDILANYSTGGVKRKSDQALSEEESAVQQKDFHNTQMHWLLTGIPNALTNDPWTQTDASLLIPSRPVNTSDPSHDILHGCHYPAGYSVLHEHSGDGVKRKADLASSAGAPADCQGTMNNSLVSSSYDPANDSHSSPKTETKYFCVQPPFPSGPLSHHHQGCLYQKSDNTAQPAPVGDLLSSTHTEKTPAPPSKRKRKGPLCRAQTTSTEESSEGVRLHEACWDGNVEVLTQHFRLSNPAYIEGSSTVVRDLLATGLVVRPFPGDCQGLVQWHNWLGTPAELAVQAGHLDCATVILAVNLYKWSCDTGWFRRRTFPAKNQFANHRNVLRNLLYSVMQAINELYCVGTLSSFSEIEHNDVNMDAFYTLLGACLLGQTNVVRILLETVDSSYWKNIEEKNQTRNKAREHLRPLTSAKLAMRAAGYGGSVGCLKLLLQAFDGFMTNDMLEEALQGILFFTWPWKSSGMKPCIDTITSHPRFQGMHDRRFYDFTVLLLDLAECWMRDLPKWVETFAYLSIQLPSRQNIMDDLWVIIPLVLHEVPVEHVAGEVNYYLNDLFHNRLEYDQESDMGKLYEFVLVTLLSNPRTENPLMTDSYQGPLSSPWRGREKEMFMILCQYMVLTHKHLKYQSTNGSCALCHPLVNFICKVRKCNRRILTEDNLWTLGSYFKQADLTSAIGFLVRGRKRNTLCQTHRARVCTKEFPLYGNVSSEEPQVVETLQKVKRGIPLAHMCLITILENLQGKGSNLDKLGLPGGLRKFFKLDNCFHNPASVPFKMRSRCNLRSSRETKVMEI